MTAVTEETFPRKFPSGTVVGGPYVQISKGSGVLVDQSAFSSYYADADAPLLHTPLRGVRASLESLDSEAAPDRSEKREALYVHSAPHQKLTGHVITAGA